MFPKQNQLKLLCQNVDFFWSMSEIDENLFLKTELTTLKCFYGHVECSFVRAIEKVHTKERKVSAPLPKKLNTQRQIINWKFFFFSKCYHGHVECKCNNPSGNYLPECEISGLNVRKL